MRAFLLAGGLGERLRPFTNTIPKCLVTVNGVPLLDIWLRLCSRYGVTHVLVNVSTHIERVERFLASRDWPLDIRLVCESRPIGNAGTVLANRAFVDNEDNFYIAYTDNLTNVALDRLLAVHQTHNMPLTIGLFRSHAPHTSGIVQTANDGLITSFTEKPREPVSDLANAGIYVARQSLFEIIPTGQLVTDFGHDVLPLLTDRMYGVLLDGYLKDIGTPATLAQAAGEWATLDHASPLPKATL